MARVSPAFSLRALFSTLPPEAVEVRRALIANGARVEERTATDGFSRQWTIETTDEARLHAAEHTLRTLLGTRLRSCEDRVLRTHRGGILRTKPTQPIQSSTDLALVDNPGAARIARLIATDSDQARLLTGKGRTIAVVSDGSGLAPPGELAPLAVLPILEAKAALHASLAHTNATPIAIDLRNVERVVDTLAAIAPTFGAIHLDAIAAPRCFAIEQALRDRVDIPVVDANQHATAIAVLAALLNALRVVGKQLEHARIVICGTGAAGTATARLLYAAGAMDVVLADRDGALDADTSREALRDFHGTTTASSPRHSLADVLAGADVFIGLAAPGALDPELVCTMAVDPIVFTLAEPEPEAQPEAIASVAAIVATGTDHGPTRIHPAYVFPGLFHALLEHGIDELTPQHAIAAAHALAGCVRSRVSATRLLPDLFDPGTIATISAAIAAVAARSDRGSPM
jgi:malate dehydrogenase (oxaloacetate-decarboxylating)